MSVESFFKLKEFDSLTKMKNEHVKLLKGHEDRLLKLSERLQLSLKDSDSLKHEYSTLQEKLFETEKKLKNAETQRQRLQDIGGDENKIKVFIEEANKAEEDGLNLLEEVEKNLSSQEELKTFQKGLQKTINEIELEVKNDISEEEAAIQQLDLRIQLIQEELPEEFRIVLNKTLSKNLAIGPFTRIENGSCFFCRFKISRTDESEIDMQQRLKVCPQCSRIFLPLGV